MSSEPSTSSSRVRRLQDALGRAGLDGAILAPGPNLRYYTGVESLLLERAFLLFVPREGELHLVVPRFEAGPYLRSPLQIRGHEWDDGSGPSRGFRGLMAELKMEGEWGAEGRVPFRYIHELQRFANIKLEDAEPVLQSIREVKEPTEVELLKKSAEVLSECFLGIPELLQPGMTELELSKKLREEAYEGGAEFAEFMVQAGKNAADPHSQPSSTKIERSEGIVIDADSTYHGYFADITRTVTLGGVGKLEDLYSAVLEAQERAIAECRPGTEVGRIDAAARGYLKERNLSKYFLHRTGHGLGLEVHEAPYLVPEGEEKLRAGMAFTVEPGVYVSGKYGIRIEDNVVVGEGKAEVITAGVPKKFGWWR